MRLRKLTALAGVIITGSILATTANFENTALAQVQIQKCISRKDVMDAQETWGKAIIAIGKAYKNGRNYKALAASTVDRLYGYDQGTVLFKPTKASRGQFRLTRAQAISYFVKGIVPEDTGFALQPWSRVRFENAGMSLGCNDAVTMGNYYFTDANTGRATKVEYTFGYRRDKYGKLRIDLHHSSLPFNPAQ
ncbi:MAG: hypothetical protein F6K62_05815 [Sphaerospermopsis sp. SIO1G2]|nr:hypothetical protein [Sphaerospermopsis sp. SIO1G1]NET70508.1 hypothetical protein [Sphaerospermopsis sp. SIO1G2]